MKLRGGFSFVCKWLSDVDMLRFVRDKLGIVFLFFVYYGFLFFVLKYDDLVVLGGLVSGMGLCFCILGQLVGLVG